MVFTKTNQSTVNYMTVFKDDYLVHNVATYAVFTAGNMIELSFLAIMLIPTYDVQVMFRSVIMKFLRLLSLLDSFTRCM